MMEFQELPSVPSHLDRRTPINSKLLSMVQYVNPVSTPVLAQANMLGRLGTTRISSSNTATVSWAL
jgi:hypothetical protein